MKKERINWIDLARGVAILFVVFGHTLSGGNVQTYVYSFHIPLFFLISGMVYHDDKLSFKEFSIKKARQLLIPYLFFGIVSVILYSIFGSFVANILGRGGKHFNIFLNFASLLYGNAKMGYYKFNNPLWFLPCLFCTNILFYLLKKILKKNHYIIGVISIIASIVIEKVGNIALPFSLENALIMLLFFELGYLLFNNRKKLRLMFSVKGVNYFCAILFIITGATFSAVNGRVRYSVGMYTNLLLFYLASIMGIMGYLLISYTINKNKILEYIGKSSLAILVLHKFPILFFQSVLPITRNYLKDNNVFVAILVAFISVCFSLVVGEFIKKRWPILLGKKEG